MNKRAFERFCKDLFAAPPKGTERFVIDAVTGKMYRFFEGYKSMAVRGDDERYYEAGGFLR